VVANYLRLYEISTHTDEREAVVDEDLARERVEIETVPMNLRIDAVPEVRQEGVIRCTWISMSCRSERCSSARKKRPPTTALQANQE